MNENREQFLIKELSKKVKSLSDKLEKTTIDLRSMRRFYNIMPANSWYVAYLQNAVFELERQCAERQECIETLNALLNKEKERNAHINT